MRRWVEALTKNIAADGFEIEFPQAPENALGDGLFYDADEPPDPEEWLDATEDERLMSVQAYHRDAEDEPLPESEKRKEPTPRSMSASRINSPPTIRRQLGTRCKGCWTKASAATMPSTPSAACCSKKWFRPSRQIAISRAMPMRPPSMR